MKVEAKKQFKPKIKLQIRDGYKFVDKVVKKNNLHTVCEEARCPNIYECWDRGTATIMILGDICTRACGFCSVKTGKPTWDDPLEPIRTALAVKKMNLRHVVITSVDRDDIKEDYGSTIWAETIKQIHHHVPGCTVEVLTPDFKGFEPALLSVFSAKPEIFSHNVECVERISKKVRSQADWKRSINVLKFAIDRGMHTKTGMMVGLGETWDEIIENMHALRSVGCDLLTIGQYLRPSEKHIALDRWYTPEEFECLKREGESLGFKHLSLIHI